VSVLNKIDLYQTHSFKARHLGLGMLPYLLKDLAKGAVLTLVNPLGRPLPYSRSTLAHQGTHSYK